MNTTARTLPLDGITVVALEQAVAAPFATRQLADLGARVIKIERPAGGDFARGYDTKVRGLASHFTWLNRSKQSLTLDIKHAEAAGIMERLLARADVFIHNLAPGAVDRLGLGVEPLRARFKRLVVCTISGYGTSGPYQRKKAYDLLVQGESGFLSITGTADAPAKAGISIADIAGGMYAYSGILTALLVRHRTGEGSALDVSLFDALEIPIQLGDRGDVRTLTIVRSRTQASRCIGGGTPLHELRARAVGGRHRIRPPAHRDAPMRHRTCAVRREDVAEGGNGSAKLE